MSADTDSTADRFALLDLAFAYARNADRVDAEALGALFVEDGVLRIINRGAEGAPMERIGRANIVSAIKRLDRYEATFHMVGNHYFEIAGDSATGEVYCIAHHVQGEAGSKRDHVMMIRYHDRYRRDSDGWRFAERELHVDWTEECVVTSGWTRPRPDVGICMYGAWMQRVWLIRAGADAEEIDPMRHAGLIGLPYTEVGDATTLTTEEIEEALIEARRPAFSQVRVQLQSFATAVKHGDLVVTPNANRREVWLSVVTGGYRFDAENPRIARYVHTRTVDWLGWLDHDATFMKDQLKVIEQNVALAEIYNREWWWKHFDSKQLSAAPRTVWKKASATRTRSSTSSSTSSSSSSSSSSRSPAAKPKPTPKPKAVAPLLCAGSCGLQWSPYVLVGGLCPDCRGD